MNTEQTYHTPNVVQQRREEAAAINAAMNPAPALPAGVGINPAPYAGKMSDEQLGELGAKACGLYCYIGDNRTTAFARAVREAVEKEQAEEIRALTAQKQAYKERAESKHGCWMQELNRAEEEITRLTAEVQSLNESYRVAGRVVREVQAELVKANAELERLRESLSRIALLPEKWENEPAGIDPSGVMDCVRELRSAFSPAPTAEEKEKLECEKWVKTQPDITHESIAIAWRAWQAARGKEAK